MSGDIFFGTSKTALYNKQAITHADIVGGVVIPDLSPGVKYYAKIIFDDPVDYAGCPSGIYYGVPLA